MKPLTKALSAGLGALVLLCATSALATDYYVRSQGGTDAVGCGTNANPCRTLKYTFSVLSPAPSAANVAVIHVGPGTYVENAAPTAPQTGFLVPNHTHLVSDRGADETVLQVDLSNLAMAGIVYVVRSEQIGMGAFNAEGIHIDGFTITVPGGEVDLPQHEVVGIGIGSSLVTNVPARDNYILNNVINVRNRNGRTNFLPQGEGVWALGGVVIDCNVFHGIDSVGIALSTVDNADAGTNLATQPAVVTRNWFYGFTNSTGLSPVSDDEYIAVGVRMPTTIRGNLFDHRRSSRTDRRFGMVCWDCTGLVVENNLFFGTDAAADTPIALVSVGQFAAMPFTPQLRHNTVAQSADGIEHYLYDANSQNNFVPQVVNNILQAPAPVIGFTQGTASYNNAAGSLAPLTGTGNISVDPRFVSPDAGNFRLQSTSPSLTASSDGGQQGAYGGNNPFGSSVNPLFPCQLREAPAGYPNPGAYGADAGSPVDAGSGMDAGSTVDAGSGMDAGSTVDAGSGMDAGVADAGFDGGVASDGGAEDAGASFDGGADVDAGSVDSGNPLDAGDGTADAGAGENELDAVGTSCGCQGSSAAGGLWPMLVLVAALSARSSRRRHLRSP
ncbi:MAG: hypothetical protein ACOZIN_18400 [Myxococcota bacterium]